MNYCTSFGIFMCQRSRMQTGNKITGYQRDNWSKFVYNNFMIEKHVKNKGAIDNKIKIFVLALKQGCM